MGWDRAGPARAELQNALRDAVSPSAHQVRLSASETHFPTWCPECLTKPWFHRRKLWQNPTFCKDLGTALLHLACNAQAPCGRNAASVQCTVTRLALAVHERFRTRPSFGPLRMRARSSARAQQQRSASSVLLAQLMLCSPPILRRGARRLAERRRACACRW